MKKLIMSILLGVPFVLGACGGGGNDANNNNGEQSVNSAGEEVYQQNCATCHGDDLSGDIGPSLEKVGADYSVDEIKEIIEEGKGQMPPGIVEGDEKDAVAEWLATHD